MHLGDPVSEIDRASQTVHSRGGLVQPYDYLVLTTGSSAFMPDIPGVEKAGVMVYHTIEDLEEIKAAVTELHVTTVDAMKKCNKAGPPRTSRRARRGKPWPTTTARPAKRRPPSLSREISPWPLAAKTCG